MRKSVRFTIFACAAAHALAAAAVAAASYVPSLGIFQATYKPGGAGRVTVVVAQERRDDPTAKIVIYVAPGYTTRLGQAPGTVLGSVIEHVQLLAPGSSGVVALTGSVKVENAANWASQAALCTGVAPEAVWSFNLAGRGQQPEVIPVFVSHTSEAEAALGSAKLTLCFRNPTLPPEQGGAANGSKFLDVVFTIRRVFRNPPRAGTPLWRSVFTPWAPGSAVANVAGAREAQAIVPMPYSLSLRRVRTRRGLFRVAGSLNRAGSRASGAKVALFAGVRRKNGISFHQLGAPATTRRGGKFVFNRRLPRKTTFVFVQRPPTEVACAPVAIAPCTTAIESNAISRVLRIAPAPRRR